MYNIIINPVTNEKYNIYSQEGKQLLKNYVKEFYGGCDPQEKKDNVIGGSFFSRITSPARRFAGPARRIGKGMRTLFEEFAGDQIQKKRKEKSIQPDVFKSRPYPYMSTPYTPYMDTTNSEPRYIPFLNIME